MGEEGPKISSIQDSTKAEEGVQFIGERNAIVFSAEAGEPLPPLELPDDFFELNKDDVHVLFKELKDNREVLENAPFKTKAVREMEDDMSTLRRLNRYTKTVLRIQFPDRLVLQAVFNHSDTVATVIDFLRQFLDPPDVQFQLYTAPPKSVLMPNVTLVDARLTPRALVYFSAVPTQDRATFLKPSFVTSLTSPRLASEAALNYRNIKQEKVKDCKVNQEAKNLTKTSCTVRKISDRIKQKDETVKKEKQPTTKKLRDRSISVMETRSNKPKTKIKISTTVQNREQKNITDVKQKAKRINKTVQIRSVGKQKNNPKNVNATKNKASNTEKSVKASKKTGTVRSTTKAKNVIKNKKRYKEKQKKQ